MSDTLDFEVKTRDDIIVAMLKGHENEDKIRFSNQDGQIHDIKSDVKSIKDDLKWVLRGILGVVGLAVLQLVVRAHT